MMLEDEEKLHILLAEDDADDSMLFTLAADVLSTPVVISLVEDGDMMMRYLETKTLPAVIFMDLNMPRRNGLECLQEIRSNPRYQSIPVVIYSTSQDRKQIEQCYHADAHRYIIKPNSFHSMIKLLKKVLVLDLSVKPALEDFLITEAD